MAFVALLDANAIWSAPVRDTLLRVADTELYRPVWTRAILDEMQRNLRSKRPDLDPAKLERTVSLIIKRFPEAIVEGYGDLIPVMTNHEGDRHVLAAAVRAHATVIVTWNGKHFPSHACTPFGIDVQDPDEFLCYLWHLDAEQLASVLQEQASALRNPPKTVSELVQTLGRHVPTFASTVRQSGLLS